MAPRTVKRRPAVDYLMMLGTLIILSLLAIFSRPRVELPRSKFHPGVVVSVSGNAPPEDAFAVTGASENDTDQSKPSPYLSSGAPVNYWGSMTSGLLNWTASTGDGGGFASSANILASSFGSGWWRGASSMGGSLITGWTGNPGPGGGWTSTSGDLNPTGSGSDLLPAAGDGASGGDGAGLGDTGAGAATAGEDHDHHNRAEVAAAPKPRKLLAVHSRRRSARDHVRLNLRKAQRAP